MIAKIEFYIDTDESINDLKKLEHHIENLIDIDNYSGINSIFGVKVIESSNKELQSVNISKGKFINN